MISAHEATLLLHLLRDPSRWRSFDELARELGHERTNGIARAAVRLRGRGLAIIRRRRADDVLRGEDPRDVRADVERER